MKHKILQYDVSRGRIPLPETILRHAGLLKPHGLTGVMLYMESVVENTVFPTAGCGDTPITADYIRRLETGLATMGLGLTPLFQVLGHQENLLSLPSCKKHGELRGGGFNFRLDRPQTRALVKKWLSEVIPLFKSDYVHAGGDEIYSIGLGRSASVIKEKGMEQALADYFNDIAAHIGGMGRRMMMYADMPIHYPALRDLLAPDIILTNWNYGVMDECYERDNHHFARHEDVCAKHKNWVVGNCMAEYIATPLRRLEENSSIWLELGAKSRAEGIIISDWGSHENCNPFALTLLGALYILRRLGDKGYSAGDFFADAALFVIGKRDRAFESAMELICMAQGDQKYFSDRRAARLMGPCMPLLLFGDPASRDSLRFFGAVSREGLESFSREARSAWQNMMGIDLKSAERPDLLQDITAVARRVYAASLRALLCYDHTWDSGSIWMTEAGAAPNVRRLNEYRELAKADIRHCDRRWKEENLESRRKDCLKFLRRAVTLMDGATKFRDNARNRFPPAGI
jgi:hypothetical protein